MRNKIKYAFFILLVTVQSFAQFNPQSKKITAKFFPDPELDIHTPAFQKKGFTNYDDMMVYLNKLVAAHPSEITLTFIGESQKNKKIPMLVLNRANQNQKLKVWFQGGLHGDEPAGTETMLFLIDKLLNDATYSYLLDKMTIAIVPMANIDGYEKQDRFAADGMDLNRDQVKLLAKESVFLKQAFSDYGAEVAVDFHEYRPFRRDFTNFGTHGMGGIYDAMFMYSGNLNLTQDLREYTKNIFIGNAKASLESNNLKFHDYITTHKVKGDIHFNQGTVDARSSTTSYALTNCISALIEIRGVELGKTSFKRRINTTLLIATSFLKTVYEDADKIKKIIRESSENYPENIVVMSEKKVEKQKIQAIDLKDNSEMTLDITVHNALESKPILERKRPFGYLILPEQKKLADKLTTLGLKLETLQTPKEIAVESYTILTKKVRPEEEEGYNAQKVTSRVNSIKKEFPAGTYILYLDQKNAKIATEVLEPENENGFVKFEVLEPEINSELPIYRYLINQKI